MHEKLTLFFAAWDNGRSEKVLAATAVSFAKVFSDRKVCIIHHVHAKETLSIQWETLKGEAIDLANPMKLNEPGKPFLANATVGDMEGETCLENQMGRFISGITSHIFINLTSDDDAQYFQLYVEHNQENFNNIIMIYLDSYIGCELILDAINQNHKINAIFDYSGQDCYSDIISKTLLTCHKYTKSIATIVSPSKKSPLKTYCYFDMSENVVRIIKDSKGRVSFLHHWIFQLYQPLDYYYSYASDDNNIKNIIYKMKSFFKIKIPFSIPHTDDQENKGFADIEKYVGSLINGRMIIALIGDSYLIKPYPMFELISILDKNELFQKDNGRITINEERVDQLAKEYRFFPIIFGSKAHKVLDDDGRNELIDYWDKFSSPEYPADKIKKVQQLIEPTLQILSRLNHQPFKKITDTTDNLLENHKEICNNIFFNAIKSLNLDIYRHIDKLEDIK